MNSDFPAPLDWESRAKGVLPLPGGYDGYLNSLKDICQIVEDLHPTPVELAKLLQEHFRELQTLSSARYRESFLRKAGILVAREGQCYVGDETKRWLRTGDAAYLIALMHSRLCFFGEMLFELQQPLHPEVIRAVADTKYGLKWNTNTQIQMRRGWLQSAKLVTIDNEQRLATTGEGRRLAGRLKLHDPLHVDATQPINGTKNDSSSDSPGVETATSRAEGLALEIVAASTDSKNADRFEQAVTEAFGFLGFQARWLGGAGKTDVLVDAPLDPERPYRVAVDAKTTGSGTLSDHQVDWMTLIEHREKHQADYSMLVGPQPSSGRLMKRAGESEVAVLSASVLAGLCRQHAEAPLGLTDYRALFAKESDDGTWIRRGGEVDTSGLDEAAGEPPRMRGVAAAIVRILSERCMTVGPLRARDLWLIMLERGEMAEGSSKEEIQGLLDMLAHPLVRAVDGDAESGYVLSSKPAVTRMRLQHLITSVAPESLS